MKKWILFLLVPVMILWSLELLSAAIFAGYFQIEPRSFWSLVIEFITYFMVGVAFLHWAPNKIPSLAYLLAAIYSVAGLSLGIYTDGNVMRILGETIVQELSLVQEIVRTMGLFIGVYGAAESEKEEHLNSIKNS